MYPDVPENHWAANNIELATRLGLVQGYEDGLFRPDQAATRAEQATVAVRSVVLAALVGGGIGLVATLLFGRKGR